MHKVRPTAREGAAEATSSTAIASARLAAAAAAQQEPYTSPQPAGKNTKLLANQAVCTTTQVNNHIIHFYSGMVLHHTRSQALSATAVGFLQAAR